MIFKEALRSLRNSMSKAVFFALTFYITTALLFVYFNMAEAASTGPEVYVTNNNLADIIELLSKGNISNLMMVFVVVMCAIDLFFCNDFFVKNKAKELAVRLICGATYIQMAMYLLIQTVLLMLVSVPLGIGTGYLMLGGLNAILAKSGADIVVGISSFALVEFWMVMLFVISVITLLNCSFAYKSGAVLLSGGNIAAMKKKGGYGVTNTKIFQLLLNLAGIIAALFPLYGFFKGSGGLAIMALIGCVGLDRTINYVLLPALTAYNRKRGTADTVKAAANGFVRRDVQFSKITVYLLIADLMVMMSMLFARENSPVEKLLIIFSYIAIAILQSLTIMFRLETDLSSRGKEFAILSQIGTETGMRHKIMHTELRRYYLFVLLLVVIYVGMALVSAAFTGGATIGEVSLLGASVIIPLIAVWLITVLYYQTILKKA